MPLSNDFRGPPAPASRDDLILEPTWALVAKAVLLGIAITAVVWVAVRAILALPSVRAYFFG